ncbi:MAG: hypothetical protein PHQ72_00430 [Hespellia sp.]|nr:hypothetical protein [Hespellia sp.]
MLDRAKFKETLESVAEIIRTAPEPMTEEEILDYFADMELNEEQKKLVFAYLTTPHENDGAEEKPEDANSDSEEPDGFTEAEIEVSPILQMYLDELSEIPPCSKVQEDKLYEQLAAGDETSIKKLADCWLGRVLDLAKKHRNAKASLEDIVQEGNMGLFLKLRELLGSKSEVDYRSLLSDCIEKSMWDFIVESGEIADEGNSVVGKMSLVQEAKKILEEQYDRGVTTQELAEYTKMPEEELQGVLDLISKAAGRTEGE